MTKTCQKIDEDIGSKIFRLKWTINSAFLTADSADDKIVILFLQ